VWRNGRLPVDDMAPSQTDMLSTSSCCSYMTPDCAKAWKRAKKKPCSAFLKA
jgi:hypothetical protein